MRVYTAANMSISCCFAFFLAVICLPVILLSLEADAQSTVDETMLCGSSAMEEVANLVRITAADVKKLLNRPTSNPTAAEPSKQALVSALHCEYLV